MPYFKSFLSFQVYHIPSLLTDICIPNYSIYIKQYIDSHINYVCITQAKRKIVPNNYTQVNAKRFSILYSNVHKKTQENYLWRYSNIKKKKKKLLYFFGVERHCMVEEQPPISYMICASIGFLYIQKIGRLSQKIISCVGLYFSTYFFSRQFQTVALASSDLCCYSYMLLYQYLSALHNSLFLSALSKNIGR